MLGWIKKKATGQFPAGSTDARDNGAASQSKAGHLARSGSQSAGATGGDASDEAFKAREREIHRVSYALVRETQRILKSAKDSSSRAQNSVPWPGTHELLALLTGSPVQQSATDAGSQSNSATAAASSDDVIDRS